MGWEMGIESSTKRKTKDLAAHGKQSLHVEVHEKTGNGFEWICGRLESVRRRGPHLRKSAALILMHRADLSCGRIVRYGRRHATNIPTGRLE